MSYELSKPPCKNCKPPQRFPGCYCKAKQEFDEWACQVKEAINKQKRYNDIFYDYKNHKPKK